MYNNKLLYIHILERQNKSHFAIKGREGRGPCKDKEEVRKIRLAWMQRSVAASDRRARLTSFYYVSPGKRKHEIFKVYLHNNFG